MLKLFLQSVIAAAVFIQFMATAQESIIDYKVAPFYRHLTTPARTIDQWEFAFENFPGATSNTSFLINSLSVGLTDWWQVGFVPLFLLFEDHRNNFNTKFNLVKEKYFQVGVGYTHFSIRLKDPFIQEQSGDRTYSPYVDLGYIFAAFNYRQPSSLWSFGFNYSVPRVSSNSTLIENVLLQQIKDENDWAFDISYLVRKELAMTFGFGEMRTDTFDLASPFAFGYGISASYIRDSRWFSRVTSGVNYSPSEDRLQLLFSFDI